ncbi:Uncharacterised protein [Porphyromonas cangingivalis]|nr:Uncharacterised protein [Porphyromonas cangingivalis]
MPLIDRMSSSSSYVLFQISNTALHLFHNGINLSLECLQLKVGIRRLLQCHGCDRKLSAQVSDLHFLLPDNGSKSILFGREYPQVFRLRMTQANELIESLLDILYQSFVCSTHAYA